jgi:hypothetical protein
MVGAGGSCKSFSFPGAFKTYANLWAGKNLVIPNQYSTSGEWHGWPQAR